MARPIASTFQGIPGERSEEYIEEVESYVARVTDITSTEEDLICEKRVVFRTSLNGDAKEKWYMKLSQENREREKVTALFKA